MALPDTTSHTPPPDALDGAAAAALALPETAADRYARAWTEADVCWFLDCSPGTLGKLIAESGFPPGVQLGATRLRRWQPAQVLAWFDAQFASSRATPAAAATAKPAEAGQGRPRTRPSGLGLPTHR